MPPNSFEVETYKGGKIYQTQTVTIKNGHLEGTWKITKGTGKYKGAKGKGTIVAAANAKSETVATLKGKITY